MATSPDSSRPQTLTLAFPVRDAAQAIDFYVRAFGAHEALRIPGPPGTIAHAQLAIGNTTFFLSEEALAPLGSYQGPATLGGTTFTGYLQLDDADAAFARAVAAGATAIFPMADQPWGTREGLIRDPFGHLWALASRN